MKFAVSVVLCALALGAAHCSVIPYILAPGSVAVHASAIPTVVDASQPVQIITSPVVAPAVVAVAPVEGTYVAKTRGAVHVAPLPGHAQSAASVNLEPAPGTA
ncbi:adult cuticle protein 1 [Eurosta solidaginis]|uniref:adult cuticle protein 1 n=1 Tax=Eurosta solidaginis TaxID=178769 RepID=UPI00353077D3